MVQARVNEVLLKNAKSTTALEWWWMTMNFERDFRFMLCNCCAKMAKENRNRLLFNQLRFWSVALEGFEPSQAEPESDVLPLHHKAISICRKANLNLFLSFSATFVAWGCSRFAIAKLGRFYQFSKYFRIFFHFFFNRTIHYLRQQLTYQRNEAIHLH